MYFERKKRFGRILFHVCKLWWSIWHKCFLHDVCILCMIIAWLSLACHPPLIMLQSLFISAFYSSRRWTMICLSFLQAWICHFYFTGLSSIYLGSGIFYCPLRKPVIMIIIISNRAMHASKCWFISSFIQNAKGINCVVSSLHLWKRWTNWFGYFLSFNNYSF